MKESFILYTEYSKHIELLSMEQRGTLLTAIMCYQTDEELPDMDGMTAMAFSFIRERLDRDNEKYAETLKKRSDAGKQGGRPKVNESKQNQTKAKKANAFSENQTKAKKANAFSENQTKAKKADNVPVLVPVPDNEHDSNLSSVCPTEPRACTYLGTGGVEKVAEEFLEFMKQYPNVQNDITNPALIASMDFKLLSQKISESRFLQTRYSLAWMIGNYRKIMSDAYRDFTPRGSPRGNEESQSEFIRRKYLEAAEEDRKNAEKNSLAAD